MNPHRSGYALLLVLLFVVLLLSLYSVAYRYTASSLRVESGYWIFCSDSEFRGECRTFGPGDYASLPGLNNAISSGRRISSSYPYGERPDWRDQYRPSQGYYRP